MSAVVGEQSPRQQIAANIRAELARKRRNAKSLVRELGWSYSAAQRRTSGHTAFDTDELLAVAWLLDVPVATFFQGVNQPGPDQRPNTHEYPQPNGRTSTPIADLINLRPNHPRLPSADELGDAA